MRCGSCARPMRPQRASEEDYPGTVLVAARGLCWACYRSGIKEPVFSPTEEPSVPVRTFLRPSVYRELMKHGQVRGKTVAELLSMLADASLSKRGRA